MRLMIMSDIHGNIAALNAVLRDSMAFTIDGCVLLGDIIDYGMHSNEVVERIKHLPYNLIVNIWGNHEQAIMEEEYTRFSTDRGSECAKYTSSILTDDVRSYIRGNMNQSGMQSFNVGSKSLLAVHGSISDPLWKAIGIDSDIDLYGDYDYVLSGHSHIPHCFEKTYPSNNIKTRNKKCCVFINPGSVGQPRNINPRAQYCLLDTESGEILFRKVDYDYELEMAAYTGQVDVFYKERLRYGV